MTTRIKALKCPHCGSVKHQQLDENRYLCNNCGTEFFLDNDDININVKHYDYERRGWSFDTFNKPEIIGRAVIIGTIVFGVMLLMFILPATCSSPATDPTTFSSGKDSIRVDEDFLTVRAFPRGKTCVAFCVSRRQYGTRYDSNADNAPRDGLYYVFFDIHTGHIVKEKLMQAASQTGGRIPYILHSDVKIRHFATTGKWYLLLPDRFVYEIDPQELILTNVNDRLTKTKKALSSGFASIEMLDYRTGEGFVFRNNLGKTYYYCPGLDHLYTKDAFDYVKDLPAAEMPGGVRDSTYYLIQNASSEESDNITRLWRIRYQYAKGDPENRLDNIGKWQLSCLAAYRITEAQPATAWFISFHPAIIYQDSRHLLLKYEASMASHIGTTFQLRNTNGDVIWTFVTDEKCDADYAVKTSTGYMIAYDFKNFIEISANGKQATQYTLPEEYNIKRP